MPLFTVNKTGLSNLIELKRFHCSDHRGFLSRLFCAEELRSFGWNTAIAQINHTNTIKKGTIRGLHFQHPPYCEMKLVTCIRGEIWDVAIDLRYNSPTFLQYHGAILSKENNISLLIPQGFAHGFQTLQDNSELLYCHSEFYNADVEDGLNPHDPTLSINWPLPVTELSTRDKNHPYINNEFKGLNI